MKILKEAVEVSGEGLESLLGEEVTFFTPNYIYAGKLVGVNSTCIKLSSPKIVYETGEFTSKTWKDAQSLPHDHYIQTSAIISFGKVK